MAHKPQRKRDLVKDLVLGNPYNRHQQFWRRLSCGCMKWFCCSVADLYGKQLLFWNTQYSVKWWVMWWGMVWMWMLLLREASEASLNMRLLCTSLLKRPAYMMIWGKFMDWWRNTKSFLMSERRLQATLPCFYSFKWMFFSVENHCQIWNKTLGKLIVQLWSG